jgi:1-phosphofructokinase family hexose kinase
MIATVTLNTALDRLIFLRRFRMGRRVVADNSVTTVGGKGTVVASLLRLLDAETKAHGFIAGPAGHIMCALLDKADVPYEFIEVEGDTRINTVLVDTEAEIQSTVIVESLRVGEPHLERMETFIRQQADAVRYWVFSGSLPPGAPPDYWNRLIETVKGAGATVLLDTSGEALRQGLRAGPLLIKPNLPELEEACGRSLPSLEHARDAAESLLEGGPEWVIATLGEQGLLAVSKEVSYLVRPLPVPVVSTSGAGDGVVAGIALGLERGADMESAIRLGAAVAASVVTQPGTASCVPADVEQYFRQIRVERMA